jgi:hypothetical protein
VSNENMYALLSSLLSLAGLWYLIFWRYRIFRIDAFRQKLFILRDELFDYADAGNIAFDHPAYGTLRRAINGYIRFGHRLTLWHVILIALSMRKENPEDWDEEMSFEQTWRRAISELDGETKTHLAAYRKRMEYAVLGHTLTAAPEFFILAPVIFVILLVSF